MRIMTFRTDPVFFVPMLSYGGDVFLEMALIAQIRLWRPLQVYVLGAMGIVANNTLTNRYGAMQISTGVAIIRMALIAQVRQRSGQSLSTPRTCLMAMAALLIVIVFGRAVLLDDLDQFNFNGWYFLNGRFSNNPFLVSVQERYALEEKAQDLVPGTTVAGAKQGQKYSGKYY